jgi:hypothetical protein
VNTGKDKPARRLDQERMHMHALQSFGMKSPSLMSVFAQHRDAVDGSNK